MAKLKLFFFFILVIAFCIDVGHLQQSTLKSVAKAKNRYFGFAVDPSTLTTDAEYASVADREFDCLTPDNHMKWKNIEAVRQVFTYEKGDFIVKHGETHGQKIRGHALLWHQEVPDYVTNGHFNASELSSVVRKHIHSVVGHYKGKIYAWDVLNEALNEDGTYRSTLFYNTIGKNYIADAFKAAYEADPVAKLYYNDYLVEGINVKSDAMYKMVKELKAQNVPIHGVGFQAHFVTNEVPKDLQKNLERFAALDLDVAITELDIRIKLPVTQEKLEQQAREYAEIVKACLAVPRCVGITTWGLTDKQSWVTWFFNGWGSALIFDEHYKGKPAYQAIKNAFEGK